MMTGFDPRTTDGESLSTPGAITPACTRPWHTALLPWTPPPGGRSGNGGSRPTAPAPAYAGRGPGPPRGNQSNLRAATALDCTDDDDLRAGDLPPPTAPGPSLGQARFVFELRLSHANSIQWRKAPA